MKLNEMFPSNYMKAADLPDEGQILTIYDVVQETFADGTSKNALEFSEIDKKLILNKTNGTTIGVLYTDESDNWIGKKIKLVAASVDFKGKRVMAVRVEPFAPKVDAIRVAKEVAPLFTTGATEAAATSRGTENTDADLDYPF